MLKKESFDELFLDRNCFCDSGKKYADCHRNAVYKHPAEISHDQIKFMHRERRCQVVEDGKQCERTTIASHSQQRRGALRAITESGHVLGFSSGPNAKPRIEEKSGLVRISAKKASTFPGLCPSHDHSIFFEIENRILEPNYRNALKLAERCAFYEAVTHTDAALFLNWLSVVPRFEIAIDVDSFASELAHMRHYGSYNWKLVNIISRIGARKSTRSLLFFAALIDATLPFSATGCFCIENDLRGRKLQPFSQRGRKFSYAQLSVLPHQDGTTLVSISTTDDKDVEASRRFIESFREIDPRSLPNAILRTILEHTENVYFRESWIADLTPKQKQELIHRFNDHRYFDVGSEKPANSLSQPLEITVQGTVLKSSHRVR